MEVDDLFNDEGLEQAALNIPLPVHDVVGSTMQSISPESRVRLDELHANGCRQRISWSKLGCVASISEDSASINIQCLRLKRRTAVWELSSKYALEFLVDEGMSHVWLHLCWSGTGTDLAVFDTRGRVSIFGMSTVSVMNRLQDLSFPNPDHDDELKQAVGTFWLPAADRESAAISQMSKQEDQWALLLNKKKPLGPIWPRALLFATRIGNLRLLYMKPDRAWAEASATLCTPAASRDLLTHASFASCVDGSVLITTHSASGKFSVYSVQVIRPHMVPDQIIMTPITLNVQQIKSDIYAGPTFDSDASSELMNGTSSTNHDITCLSHLETVPTTDIEKVAQFPPTIFAINTVFSSIPGINDSLQPKSSIIHRWSLYNVSTALHSRFDEISTKGISNSIGSPTSIKNLQRLSSISFDSIITSVHLVDNSSTLAITTIDGTTSFYNPSTTSPIFYESSSQEVTSLSQAGFAFSPMNSPFDICFSPNACCAVFLPSASNDADTKEAPKLSLATMSHHSGLEESIDSNLESALISLILTYTRACYNGSSSDDLLTCILGTVRPVHLPKLTQMMLSTLFRDGDFVRQGGQGSELDKLAHKNLVPKCLSLIAALGVNQAGILSGSTNASVGKRRDIPGQYSWLILQVRHVAMQLIYVVNVTKSGDRLPPVIVSVMAGSVVWAMSLCRWMLDELCAIDDGEDEAAHGTRELVSLMLGGVWSRYFLKMTEKVLRMFASSQTGSVSEIVGAVREQQGMGLTLAGLGTLLEAAERFSVETGPRDEKELIAAGESKQTGLLERIVKEVLPGMRKSRDVDKLAIYTSGMKQPLDWTLLEEGDIDIHRKIEVKSRGEVRRCVRCASISEDIGGPKREWPKWIQQQMMRCVCEGSFWVEGFED